jgi:ribosome biogenesis protein ERB1
MIAVPERVRTAVQWEQAEEDNWEAGLRIIVNHFKELKQVS